MVARHEYWLSIQENALHGKIALTTVLKQFRLYEYVVSDIVKSVMSTGMSKPEIHVRCTDHHDMTKDVKIAFKLKFKDTMASE